MTRFLVTGATGKIGNAVAHMLIEQDHEVVALVRNPERAAGLLPESVILAAGDVTDHESCVRAAQQVDAVFNCMGIYEQWLPDPARFEAVNAQGAFNVASAARAAGARRFVHTSTIDVFECEPGGTVRESQLATAPKDTAYERSKQLAEHLVLGQAADDLEVVIVNPGSAYGPGPWAKRGLDSVVRDALRGRLPAVPSGGSSLVFVDDVAAAHVAAFERGRPGERYLLAGSFASTRDICRVAVEHAGRGRVPIELPRTMARGLAGLGESLARLTRRSPLLPKGQLHYLTWSAHADCSKARAELGFDPIDWHEGIMRLVDWMVATGRLS